jgi:uncharacterized protein DUF1835/uncharacterized protein DUF3658
MIHIVFNEVEVDLMKKVMEQDPELEGEVLLIRDDFAVGPLAGLDTEEGWNERVEWWRSLLEGSPYGPALAGSFDDRQTVAELITKLRENEEENVRIWMGQNQHDVMGYYWLMPQLRDFQGRIHIIYMNNLPCINEKGQLFYPSWLHEIQPRELIKAKILTRTLTTSEFEVDPDEWQRLANENSMVRMLEGGKKIASQEEDFYDAELLKNISGEWQKSWRVLSNTHNRMKIKTGDVFIMWRMKKLIADGKIEVTGETKTWKDFDVRIAGKKQESGVEQKSEAGA